MSLNKFTEDETRKEWMIINCKNIYSESTKVDKYTEVVKGSVTAPPADSVRLYNRSGDDLAYVKSSGESLLLATAPINSIFSPSLYFSQSEPQQVPATIATYGNSILDSVSAGRGSLTIPANSLGGDAMYELTVSGTFEVLTAVKLINFGVFLDGALHREGKSTASLSVAGDEAFTAHIYLSCRDQGDGNVILYPSGKITTSGGGNLSVVPLTGAGGTFNTPIPINVDHVIDLRTTWTSNDGDSATGDYATLMRCG